METQHHISKKARRLFDAACHWFTSHYWIYPDLPPESPTPGAGSKGSTPKRWAHASVHHSDNRHGDYGT